MDLSQWSDTFTILYAKTWRDAISWRNEPATPFQVRGLNLLLRQGMLDKANRECKLDIVSKLINREIESTNELTKIEAHVLINILKDEKVSGEKNWVLSPDGVNWIYQAEINWLEAKYMVGTM